MSWRPSIIDLEKPLYLAIADALERDVETGSLRPGQRLPTQREMAGIFGVNLSTITRAFKECERRGLISGTVGRGTFISVDIGVTVPLARSESVLDSRLIELGLVLPLYALEPDLESLIGSLSAGGGLNRYLRYVDPRGMAEHREAGARWAGRYGLRVAAEDVLVAAGTQNALAAAIMALLKPGDRVAVDALTYPGLKTLAGMAGIRLVPVEMDEGGIVPEALEAACRREAPRALYLMPEIQNPTTSVLSQSRREEVAAIVERHGLYLFEDEAYGELGEERLPALSSLCPERALFIGGISKVFGAGLRIAFMAAPGRLRRRLETAILGSVWMASPLNGAIAAQMILSGAVDATLRAKREEARRRAELARGLFSGRDFRCPPTGYFGWLTLPSGWSGREFELEAREAGVRVFCAEKFAVGREAPAAVRVSLSGPETGEELARGLSILGGLLREGPRRTECLL